MKKLNLGCGYDIRNGWVNLDKFDSKGVNIVHDLEKLPYPFKDNAFDEVVAKDVFNEQTTPFYEIMEELIRITKNGGRIKLWVYHFSSSYSYSFTNVKNFCYTDFEYSPFPYREFFKKLKIIERKIVFEKNWLLFLNYFMEKIVNFWKFPYHYERTCWRNIFPANKIHFEVEVNK